jgi:hypothetical protein
MIDGPIVEGGIFKMRAGADGEAKVMEFRE